MPLLCQAHCQILPHVIAFTSYNNLIRQGLLTLFYSEKNSGLRRWTSSKVASSKILHLEELKAKVMPYSKKVFTSWPHSNMSHSFML